MKFDQLSKLCNRIRACNMSSLQQNQAAYALMSNSSCSSWASW